MTSIGELLQMIDQCDLADLPPDRAITGADETVEEGFAGLMADGASIEMGMVPGQAAVSISIRYPSDKAEQTDEPERKPRLGHE